MIPIFGFDRFTQMQTHSNTSTPDWFYSLFGFYEESYDDAQSKFQNTHALAQYTIGKFSTPSLATLRSINPSRLPGRLTLKIVRGDVSVLHGNPENRFAVFQVASQFNCLEFVSPHTTPEHGITNYALDRTQGPACAISCGPATAHRNYCVRFANGVGQTSSRQINCLGELLKEVGNDDVTVKNGYTIASPQSLKRLNAKLATMDLDSLRSVIRIGVQQDTQVTSTHFGERQIRDPEQLVTQVFSAACAVGYSHADAQDWEPLSRLVLEATYEGVLRVAIWNALIHEQPSCRVFLTSVGGGVFGNEIGWIVGAMDRALNMFQNVNLDVRIVCYDNPSREMLNLVERYQ